MSSGSGRLLHHLILFDSFFSRAPSSSSFCHNGCSIIDVDAPYVVFWYVRLLWSSPSHPDLLHAQGGSSFSLFSLERKEKKYLSLALLASFLLLVVLELPALSSPSFSSPLLLASFASSPPNPVQGSRPASPSAPGGTGAQQPRAPAPWPERGISAGRCPRPRRMRHSGP